MKIFELWHTASVAEQRW